MSRLEPHFPKSRGKPHVDDKRVLSAIILVNRHGLRWRDAPKEYGPYMTLYNRRKQWKQVANAIGPSAGTNRGVFAPMMVGLAAQHSEKTTAMIDATYLKAPRSASTMAAKKTGMTV